jgi:hypothetical protein
MKLCQSAALALVSWYLIAPPVTIPQDSDDPPAATVDSAAALSKWTRWGTYDDEGLCDSARTNMVNNLLTSLPKREFPKNMSATNVAQSRQNFLDAVQTLRCISSDDPELQQNSDNTPAQAEPAENQPAETDNSGQSAQDNNGNQPTEDQQNQPAGNGDAPSDSAQPPQN